MNRPKRPSTKALSEKGITVNSADFPAPASATIAAFIGCFFCLQIKKEVRTLVSHTSFYQMNKVSTSFCSLLSQNTFESPACCSPYHRSMSGWLAQHCS